ncbi:hypothetical protein Btru_073032, partial [Bulinus truncatus]
MASETGSLDDIVVTLMSMGFELNDCQEAITNGKLTVQSAVDWILSGKPGNVAEPQKSLLLNKPAPASLGGGSSNPFVPANISSLTTTSDHDMPATSVEAMGVDINDDTVISRCHLSEKQQQIKLNFQEKERLEAKRLASEEKKRKKNERERILKEIQEDREKVKLVKQTKLEPASLPPDVPQTNTAVREPADGQEDNNSTTSIQVRLPSGLMFRQTFSVHSTLYNVWESVCSQLKTAIVAYCGFIQPFPRKEFSRDEMRYTLKALGLVPSGSLVLKKKDVEQASAQDPATLQSPVIMRALGQLDDREEEDDREDEWNVVGPPNHAWGRGLRVDGEEPMDIGNEEDIDQFGGLAAHPIIGNHQDHRFEGFGNRLVPEGIPGDDNRHLNRRAPEMAAEAAQQRSQNLPSTSRSRLDTRASISEHYFNVRSLQDMAMLAMARKFTDPRNPVYSMSGLSEELLQKFLTYLMKEGLLKPKLLHTLPSYLLKLVLDFYPYTTNELLYSARIFVNLHTLSLNSCTLITDSGLSPIKGMKALRVLNLNGCSQLTNACFSTIQELKQLQTLNLEGTGVTDAGIIQFSGTDTAAQLVHLDLSRTAITHEIFLSLQNMKLLKSLYIKNTRISSLAGLESVTSLENLDISETNIVTDCILCLTRLPRLSHLSLTGTQDVHGDKALFYLKEMKLLALYLPSRSTTSDVGMTYISGFQLSTLDLTNYINVGDPSMPYIGQIVSLKKLLLTNTKISDEGMQHLTGLVNLEVLFVDRTVVSNAGAAVVV